jgi:hypothetical protein
VYNILDSLFFSIDMLLPIISFDKRHETEIFSNENGYRTWVVYYFYIHQFVGYFLAFFFAAGLSGLTK